MTKLAKLFAAAPKPRYDAYMASVTDDTFNEDDARLALHDDATAFIQTQTEVYGAAATMNALDGATADSLATGYLDNIE
jgi:hypothetical protein